MSRTAAKLKWLLLAVALLLPAAALAHGDGHHSANAQGQAAERHTESTASDVEVAAAPASCPNGGGACCCSSVCCSGPEGARVVAPHPALSWTLAAAPTHLEPAHAPVLARRLTRLAPLGARAPPHAALP